MIPRIDQNLGIAGEPNEWVHSACLLCSNGCGLDIAVKDGRIVGVRGQPDHPVSSGPRVSTPGSPTIPSAAARRR